MITFKEFEDNLNERLVDKEFNELCIDKIIQLHINDMLSKCGYGWNLLFNNNSLFEINEIEDKLIKLNYDTLITQIENYNNGMEKFDYRVFKIKNIKLEIDNEIKDIDNFDDYIKYVENKRNEEKRKKAEKNNDMYENYLKMLKEYGLTKTQTFNVIFSYLALDEEHKKQFSKFTDKDK